MFFKLVDKYKITKAPRPLHIEGKDVFTTSEQIHNGQGYYRLVETDYPEDNKAYRPIYSMGDGVILQTYKEITLNTEEGATV